MGLRNGEGGFEATSRAKVVAVGVFEEMEGGARLQAEPIVGYHVYHLRHFIFLTQLYKHFLIVLVV